MSTFGDNKKTKQEQYEDQQFLRGFVEIKKLESNMAGTKGDLSALLNRLKDIGWTKKDFDFAKSLQDKDVGQVVSDFERKIRIAKLFGHAIGRQLDFLSDDNVDEKEKAFDAGRVAGMLRKDMSNPFQAATEEYNAWQEGFSQGNAFINKDLASAVAEEGGDI